MRVFVLLLSILIGVRTISCPENYSDGGDGSCYLMFSSFAKARDRIDDCADEGAYLTDVGNAFQNTAVGHRAGSVDFVWLGLTCLNNSITSCQWDTGVSMASTSYNNFDGGRPVVDDGPCVLMEVKTGKWFSADCSNTKVSFLCKYTPNIKVPYCDPYFGYFRGKCYYTPSVYSASIDCTNYLHNGVEASIHSQGENAYVKGLGVYYGNGMTQLFLGIQQNGIWTDGTAVDYQNYCYKNPALGSCTSMSLYGDPVPAGMWVSSQCTAPQGALVVCKGDPVEPTPVATMSPLQCSGTQFLSDYGTVYSPGYPLGSQPNHCEYVITEDEGYQVQIDLNDVQLDKNSALQLFSGLFDKIPFVNLTNTNINYRSYQSPTNVLKIVYDTAGSENSQNQWYGNYERIGAGIQTTEEIVSETSITQESTSGASSTYDDCGQWHYGSGTIESPNFPYNYPEVTSECSYLLESYGPSTCFKFDEFNIRNGDFVTLYDGYSWQDIELANSTGSDRPDGIYCTYQNRFMTVVFTTYWYNEGYVSGWSGSFAADSSELAGSTPWY